MVKCSVQAIMVASAVTMVKKELDVLFADRVIILRKVLWPMRAAFRCKIFKAIILKQ